jgi:hypothetical protein
MPNVLDLLGEKGAKGATPNSDTLTTGNASPDSANVLSLLASGKGVAEPPTTGKPQGEGIGRRFLRSGVNSLPFAGAALLGTAGALATPELGGAGGVPAAMVGGAGGEAWKQNLTRALGLGEAPGSAGEAVQKMTGQAELQGANQLIPPALKAGGRLAGGALMAAAGRLNPELAQTALEEKIPISQVGLNKLMKRLGELGQVSTRLLSLATKRGVRFDPNKDVVQPALASVMPEVKAGDDPTGETDKLMGYAMKWLEGRFKPTAAPSEALGPSSNYIDQGGGGALPDKISPSELGKAKQAADAVADPMHAGAARGEVTNFDPLRQRFNKAIADRIRELFSGIEEVKDVSQRESRLIALKERVWPTVGKDIGFAGRLARPTLTGLAGAGVGAALPGSREERSLHGLAGLALGAGLGSPAGMSNAALALQGPSNPLVQTMLAQNPRLMEMFAQNLRSGQ